MAWQHGRKCKRTDIRHRACIRPPVPSHFTNAWYTLITVSRPWQTIIAALLAFWMPLCCCQIAAIAGTGAPCCAKPEVSAPRTASESCCATVQVPSCCAVKVTPAPECCTEAERAACCPDEPCDDVAHPSGDDRAPASDPCTCCATKAPAPEQDPVDPILSAHATASAIPAWLLASCACDAPVLACTGPPDGERGAPWSSGQWPCAHAAERCAQLSSWTE
jgi:hypothetical protein